MTEAFIYDAIRTLRGRGKDIGSAPCDEPISLIQGPLGAAPERNPDLDKQQVEDIILACVSPIGGQGGNIARTAAIAAGFEPSGPVFQLKPFCASRLEAVNVAAQKVRSGREDLIFAGGVESMSRVSMLSDGGPWSQDPANAHRVYFVPKDVSADLIATVERFTRTELDTYVADSQDRAEKAIASGAFARSIVPVKDINGAVVLDHDELPRPGTTVAVLSALRPSFERLAIVGGSTMWPSRSTTGSRRSTICTLRATAPALLTAPASLSSDPRSSARSTDWPLAPASSPLRLSAASRRSCLPALPPLPRRLWPRPHRHHFLYLLWKVTSARPAWRKPTWRFSAGCEW